MPRSMADALHTANLAHAPVDIKAYYPYDNPDQITPTAKQVLSIDNSPDGSHHNCHIADAEPGAMTWASVPAWVQSCTQQYPTVYCALSNLSPYLFPHMATVGRHWYLWVAQWDDSTVLPDIPDLPPECTLIGKQYSSNQIDDLSIITEDDWYPIGGENVFVQLPGVPGEWINPQQSFDTQTGTLYVTGVGTTGHFYLTKSTDGGKSWSSPVVP